MPGEMIITHQAMVIAIILSLLIVVILSSISAGKTINSKCYKMDEDLKKSYNYTKYTAILSGLLVGLIIIIYIAYLWYTNPGKPRLTRPGFFFDPYVLILGSLLGFLMLGSLISSAISTYYAYEAKCKDKDSKEAFKYSLICLIYSLIIVIMLAAIGGIYIYARHSSPLDPEDLKKTIERMERQDILREERAEKLLARRQAEEARAEEARQLMEKYSEIMKLRREKFPMRKGGKSPKKEPSKRLLITKEEEGVSSEEEGEGTEGELSEEEQLLEEYFLQHGSEEFT